VGQFVRRLRPARRQVAFFLVTEVVLRAIGAPFWVHLVVVGLVHVIVDGVHGRS
jgi:hypothetical protein